MRLHLKKRRFRDAKDGSVAIEFAFIGGLLVVLIMAVMQVGMYFYISATLHRATGKAARQVMTGQVSAGSMSADQFRTSVLCPYLPAGLSCANVIINMVSVSSDAGFYQFVNAKKSGVIQPAVMDNTQTKFCTGGPGSTIYMQVYYAMPIFSPVLLKGFISSYKGQSAYFVAAYSAFRNEPFAATSTSGC